MIAITNITVINNNLIIITVHASELSLYEFNNNNLVIYHAKILTVVTTTATTTIILH